MKRKMSKAKAVKKTTRQVQRSSASQSIPAISIHRIIIFSACVLLVIFGIAFVKSGNVTKSVAGISIARGLFDQATVSIPQAPNAVTYNIYYKSADDSSFDHAVSDIPSTVTTYTISYLKKNTTYQYKISAADRSGKEFWWSPVRTFTDLQPM